MQLRDYRKWKGITLAQIAAETGQSIMSVSRQERGLRHVDAVMREKYREITGGSVTPEDWHQLELSALSSFKTAYRPRPSQRKEVTHA